MRAFITRMEVTSTPYGNRAEVTITAVISEYDEETAKLLYGGAGEIELTPLPTRDYSLPPPLPPEPLIMTEEAYRVGRRVIFPKKA